MSDQNESAMKDNPFAALFPSVEAAVEYAKKGDELDHGMPEQINDVEMISQGEVEANVQTLDEIGSSGLDLNQEKNCLLERIFLLTDSNLVENDQTLSDNLPAFCIRLENDDDIPLHEAIEQMIFNRLLLSDLEINIVKRSEATDDASETEAKEDRPLIYLLQSFNRMVHEEKYVSPQLLPTITLCRQLIVRNISTALISPELFDSEKGTVHQQFYNLLASNDCMDPQSPPRLCLYDAADYIATTDPQLMETAFVPMLDILSEDLKMDDLLDAGLTVHIAVLATMAGHSHLAGLSLDYKSKPVNVALLNQGQTKTMLEILLGKSCLVPDARTRAYLFFEDIRRMGPGEVENEEYHLHTKTDSFHSQLLKVMRLFLKHDLTRSKTLQWIGNFLLRYEYLAKMWTHEHIDVFMDVFGPDAALLNLSAVLVRLCLPFCSNESTVSSSSKESSKNAPKFLRIDASYVYATGQQNVYERGVHGINLHKDTCLQSVGEGINLSVDMAESYNFITECFFLTHRAIYLGVHGLLKKFSRLNRVLSREEDLYRQLRQSGDETNDRASQIVQRFETGMRIYLSIKGILSEPNFLGGCLKLHATTAQYLNQIAMTDSMDHLAQVVLPFPDEQTTPKSLFCVPEYVVENMTDMILFLWRFSRSSLYMIDPFVHDFLLVITIYMGNKSRMSNPHLRASLAEILQVVMPLSDDGSMLSDREEIFNKFPHTAFLTVATLQLFVDIEFTGDPNQFEQKFHYRQPLYKILKYLWRKKTCNKMIKVKVNEAIANIDNATHPLFLQFTNLLLNDSIYLLDEAMDFLKQIKGLEREKDAGDWEELNQREKAEKEGELKQLGMLAKYHNILSNDTMDTLVYLTEAKEVRNLFSHLLLSDRLAAMLDDFLLKLVGPKMGALRVRDLSVYKFQPKVLVVDLCKIYINLCQNDEFCRAISRDGRSYGPKLFPMACQVLRRIGFEDIREKMLEISEKIKLISNQDEEDEELFVDAPDEFYDALMSTLMKDPVTLPASKQVVDRSTISRHLMSDPTDPFNRSPLTMQDVIPNVELKTKIEQWITDKRSGR